LSYYKKHIFICTNQKAPGKTCCANSGGEPFFDYLKKRLQALGLYGPGQCRVSKSGCLGRCLLGPSLVIYPEGVWYNYASLSDIDEIIATHLVSGALVERLFLNPTE
jgi:(2Fe-2S) ferredoxin